MEALTKVYQHQVCQICTTGLPDCQFSPYCITFVHNFTSNWLRNIIFNQNPYFFRTVNLMEALSKVYNHPGFQICTEGLPDCQFLPYFIAFMNPLDCSLPLDSMWFLTIKNGFWQKNHVSKSIRRKVVYKGYTIWCKLAIWQPCCTSLATLIIIHFSNCFR